MKNKILTTIVSGLLVTVLATTIVSAADAGSSADPLVTKSYVDTKVNELKAQIATLVSNNANNTNTENTNTENTNNTNTNNTNDENTTSETTGDVPSSQYQVVQVPKGSKIIGGEGTEMILRSGSATVVTPISNGLVNMTVGIDAANGTSVPKNNLMIVPRADGRGFYITADSTYVMVRGNYEIK